MIDLHLHSAASDGEHPPEEVVRLARAAGLGTIALTDHDTLAGVRAAARCGRQEGVHVIAGCEFSVAASWGEMHLLAYFLPDDDGPVAVFLAEQRLRRRERAVEMVERLNRLGVSVEERDVLAVAGGGAVGRPHVARALVQRAAVSDVHEAFRRYIGAGRPAFVPKTMASVAEVAALVREAGGVTSAAHLKDRGTRSALDALCTAGVDGVEVRHPSHDEATVHRLMRLAKDRGLLPTGGSDWHGTSSVSADRAGLGDLTIPAEWLASLEDLHGRRAPVKENAP